MDPSSSRAEEIERLLGYTFLDPSLLTEALTHGSYDRPSYKHLEFVGDSTLGLAVTKFLYSTDPNLDNVRVSFFYISALCNANVSNEKLTRHNFYRFLRHNCAALDRAVSNFTESVTTRGEENAGELSYGGGIRNACKVLTDIVESMAGAVYINCNFDLEVVWQVINLDIPLSPS
ncbi:hypothetical protein Cni_G16277 [Canna indica]|uniref:RNase III domain-containing protein n=1 Tax=Canna indica TaxID=4628 RepID=A0AAQ3KEX0_9LILI|nr:hypothetical protein Cni_G16277 [Canna indica]